MFRKISDDPRVQQAYEAMRRKGETHMLAEMLAFQQPPISQTDREFLAGHCNGNQFEKNPHIGDYYKDIAKDAGVNTTGKVYLSGLADFPGDPKAWVDGRGDVRRVVEERGWGCDGDVKVKPRFKEEAPPPKVKLADDIVDEYVAAELAVMEEPHKADIQELKEKVIEKHGQPY